MLIVGPACEREEAEQVGRRAMTALQAPVRISGIDIHISRVLGSRSIPLTPARPRTLSRAPMLRCTAPSSAVAQRAMFCTGMDTTTRERVQLESDLHSCAQAAAVRDLLSAQSGHGYRHAAQRRGSYTLATSPARPLLTRAVYLASRRMRADHLHRRVGATRGLPPV